MLDLNMYVGDDGLIKYENYEKPCASKFVIPSNSDHSKKMKMSVLVEEGMRRMRNCAGGLESQVRRRVMTAYAKKLRRSGWPTTTRHQVMKEVGPCWRTIVRDPSTGLENGNNLPRG